MPTKTGEAKTPLFLPGNTRLCSAVDASSARLDDQQGAGHDPKGPTPAARPGPGQSRLFRAARQWLWDAQEPAPAGAGRL